MLTFGGRERGRFCDGRSRRDFLKVGGLALGGLALPDLLRAEAASGVKSSHKAVIMVFLPGGPAHQDTVDLKPGAPSGIRGEFQPIPTNVPGLDICELMPNMARIMDKVAVLRAVVGAKDEHAAFQCLTGFTSGESKRQGGRPSLGSVVSKVQGPMVEEVPPFIGLSGKMTYKPWSDNGDPGYLGLAHAPYQPNGAELPDLSRQGLSLGRVGNRRNLLHKLDGLRRAVDRSAITTGLDSFQKTAFDILSSRELARALDVTREDPKIRARYGFGEPANMLDGGPCWNDQFLMARRLVEAGARVVTVGFGRWDNHSQNFPRCRVQLPKLDVALSALIEDLHMRGARQGRDGHRLGGVRPEPDDQRQRRSGALAEGLLCPARRRRDEDRPGHRLDRPLGRIAEGPARLVPERLCDPLPQPRDQPDDDAARPRGEADGPAG